MDATLVPVLIQVARGDRPADLLIRNARLINVFIGKVVQTEIAVSHGYVVGFGAYRALNTIDLKGLFMAPGFIDAHVHIESAMVGPSQFAQAVLPHGTTAVVADPHEIANVLGSAGIELMLTMSKGLPLNFYFSLPSCVPATSMETAGARLDAEMLAPYMEHPRIVALAEMMDFPGVLQTRADVMAKLTIAQKARKPTNGHAPGLSGYHLNAYLAAGMSTDHECITSAEALEKLAAGMHVMVRQGTGARNLDDLLPIIDTFNSRRMMWCTDDRNPHDITIDGHIDGMVRRAITVGVDPVIAIQMATLNPAEHFRLNDIGAIAPGRRADFLVFDDLKNPVVRQVFSGGKLVAQEGQLIDSSLCSSHPVACPPSVNVALQSIDLKVKATGRRIRLIETIPQQIFTSSRITEANIIDSYAVSDPQRDLLKIAVIERHRGSGRAGIGFVRGFGLKYGAIAATVAHDSHNIVTIGVEDADMYAAAVELINMGGGLVVVQHQQIVARLPLPVAGLMSEQPLDTVCQGLDSVLSAAHNLGTSMDDPFAVMSFMALPVIPELKITDKGLVDVQKFEIVPLFID